jgi:hypothetical protein
MQVSKILPVSGITVYVMKTSNCKPKEFPLVKEVNAQRILAALLLLRQFPLDRDAQRDAILSLYRQKEEKSVFRGMVIPSFRKLGLLQGWEDMISLSANGLVIAEAAGASLDFGMRAFRAVLLEKDREYLSIVEVHVRETITTVQLYQRLYREIASPSDIQRRERLKRWTALLCGAGLLQKTADHLCMAQSAVTVAQQDLNHAPKSPHFTEILFRSYNELVQRQHQVDVVDIADLRSVVATRYCRQLKLILTERQFDTLLRVVPITTEKYLISFGKPMGPEEKLFEMKGQYYRTLSIRDLGR